jgi:hypothetical protein
MAHLTGFEPVTFGIRIQITNVGPKRKSQIPRSAAELQARNLLSGLDFGLI